MARFSLALVLAAALLAVACGQECHDNTPDKELDCPSLIALGSKLCNEGWILDGNYCMRSCGRNPCPAVQLDTSQGSVTLVGKRTGEQKASGPPPASVTLTPDTVPVEAPVDYSEPSSTPAAVTEPAEVAEVPETTEVPEVVETTEVPEVTETAETTEVPEVVETSEVPEVVETSEVPEVTEVPETTEVPEVAEASEVPEVTEVPETTEVPEVAEASEVPEVTEVPETTEVPEVAETSEVPEVPEVLPESREVPEMSEPQVQEPSASECEIPSALIARRGDFSFLKEVLERTNLIGTLNGFSGTVFAPTNGAFDKLLSLLELSREAFFAGNAQVIEQLLKIHVIPGEFINADTSKDVVSLLGDGQKIKVQGDKVTSPAGPTAMITERIDACNAVIAVVDSVIIPRPVEGTTSG